MENEHVSPPEGLSDRSKALWKALVGKRVRSPGRVVLFEQALQCLDRADNAAATLAEQGLTVVTTKTGCSHLNPLARVEQQSRALFAQIWAKLHLEWDGSVDGRGER